MLTLVIGSKHLAERQHYKLSRADAGFSLIELMVVMVIIGLMTTAVVVLVPPQTSSMLDSAEHTAATTTALARQSVMSGQVYAVDVRDGNLDVRTQTVDGWVKAPFAVVKTNTFVAASTLIIDGVEVTSSQQNSGFIPQIWFLPSGEFQSFEMVASEADKEIRLIASPTQSAKVTVDAR